MRRPLIMLVSLAAVLAAGLAGAPAQAGEDVRHIVGIADAQVRTYATASTSTPFVWMQPRLENPLQRWSVELNSSTAGDRIVNVGTAGCLSVSTVGPTPEGAPVLQASCRSLPAELWRIVPDAGPTTVRIVHTRSGKCLTTEEFSPGRYAQLRVFTCGNLATQHFRLVPEL